MVKGGTFEVELSARKQHERDSKRERTEGTGNKGPENEERKAGLNKKGTHFQEVGHVGGRTKIEGRRIVQILRG